MQRKEKTTLSDSIRFRTETTFTPKTIPNLEPPSSRIFELRNYKERDWMLLFMDKELFEEINTLCRERNLDPRNVLYGSFIMLKRMLRGK